MKSGDLPEKAAGKPGLKKVFTGTFTAAGSLISIAVFAVMVAIMLLSRSSVELREDSVKASAVLVSPVEVSYEDIESVQLLNRDELALGEKTRGFSNLFTIAGSYVNEEYGIYDVYLSKANKVNCILIRYLDVGYAVFNTGDPAETRQIYEELLLRASGA